MCELSYNSSASYNNNSCESSKLLTVTVKCMYSSDVYIFSGTHVVKIN